MNLREWALPIYTILMQIATGIILLLWMIRLLGISKFSYSEMRRLTDNPLTIALFTILVAMVGAHFHLSRPNLSLLALLNFRSSWLSREILFTILSLLTVGGLWIARRYTKILERQDTFLGWLAIAFGWANIYCMARVYLLPTQTAWNSPLTILYFFGTTLLLGAMAVAALLIMDLRFSEVREPQQPRQRIPLIQRSLHWLTLLAVSMIIFVISLTFFQLSSLKHTDVTSSTSLALLYELYQPLFILRLGLSIIGVLWLVFSLSQMRRKLRSVQELMSPVLGACLLVMIGEILGRFLFYATHVRIGI